MSDETSVTSGEAISRVERVGGEVEAKFDVGAFEKARAEDDAGKVKPQSEDVQSEKSVADATATEGKKEGEEDSRVNESSSPSSAPMNPFEKNPTKAAQWKEMKTKHANEVAALQKQLVELQEAQGKGSEELAKERDEYRNRLREVALERDPEFNRKYEVQMESAIEGARQAAGAKGDELASLLKGPGGPWRDQKVNELLGEVDDMSKVRLMGALQTLSTIEFQKQSEIQASLSNWDRQQEELSVMSQQQQAETQRQYEEIFEKKLGELQGDGKLGNWLFKQIEGNEEHNKSVAQSVDEAKIIMRGQMTPEKAVEIALNQGAYPRLVSAFNDVVAERDALHEKLNELQEAQPGIGSPGITKDGGTNMKVGDPQYAQYLANGIAAAQAQDRAGKM